MFELTDLLILFLFGCAGGVLAGLLGIGGGLIYVIAISYYLQQQGLDNVELVKFTVSNSIFAVFFAGLSGTIKQILRKNFYFREVIVTAIPGIAGSLIVSYFIVSYNWYTQAQYNSVIIIILGILAYRMLLPEHRKTLYLDDLPAFYFLTGGFFSGVISAFSGLGGGIILIPVLSGMMRLNIIKAASISLGIMPLYTMAMAIFYAFAYTGPPMEFPWNLGYLILPLAIPLALGVVIFAPIGVKLAHRLSKPVLKFIFGILILLVIGKMIYGILQ